VSAGLPSWFALLESSPASKMPAGLRERHPAGMAYGGQDFRSSQAAYSSTCFMLPPFPDLDQVLDYHLVGVRTTLDSFGSADPERFEAHLRKAG